MREPGRGDVSLSLQPRPPQSKGKRSRAFGGQSIQVASQTSRGPFAVPAPCLATAYGRAAAGTSRRPTANFQIL